MTVLSKAQMYVTAAAIIVSCAYAAVCFYKQYKKSRAHRAFEAFNLNIHVVSNSEECDPLIYELRRRSMGYNAVGFDCEWVTVGGRRKPVALLQLATYDGFCVLIRLNLIDEPLPPALIAFLKDAGIYKVGVGPLHDAQYLYQDYGVSTASTVDLRHIAKICDCTVGGLAYLTETLLGVVLDKSLKVRCSDWDAETLSPAQLHYAASDAYAAVRVFVELIDKLDVPSYRAAYGVDADDTIWEAIDDVCSQFADYHYKHVNTKDEQGSSTKVKKIKEWSDNSVKKNYPHLKRSKPLYDNCFLQAPDGEVLCTIDRRKAKWYLENNLADQIDESPLTVRLRFEPAGRSVGEVGRYYTLVKQNQCVVCGEKDSYIRKNVIPKEYRKYFPEILKDHSSHDIVLLCARCHQRSNIRDQSKRDQLAVQCRSPLPTANAGKNIEDKRCKKVRMAARALYNNRVGKHVLPEARQRTLGEEVLTYYTDCTEVTDQLLEEAMCLSVMVENENYNAESHGEGVVRHFLTHERSGLLALEELWRRHFLTSMRPRHMPHLWSLTHTHDRLKVKWKEGRLSDEQLRSIGAEESLFEEQS